MDAEPQRVYGPEHTLVWALLLLQAMKKSGLSPCDNRLFHRLIYFGNTLARLYDFQPPAEIVMRHPRGPFYPRAQFDLDRLCVLGLAKVSGYHLAKREGFVERLGEYDISEAGFRRADMLRKQVRWATTASTFLFDLSIAFASMSGEFTADAESRDPTYMSRKSEPSPVINFQEMRRNLSLSTTYALESRFPKNLRPIPQHSLRLYVRYLEQLAA